METMDITNIFSQEEIEKYFVRCEYGNWHDAWNDPQSGRPNNLEGIYAEEVCVVPEIIKRAKQ